MTLLGLLSARAEATEAARIHLRGSARIDAHAARVDGKLAISGVVTDDLGAPQEARVAIDLARGDAAAGGPLHPHVPLSQLAPESCDEAAARPRRAIALDGPNRMIATTDGSGRFCVRAAIPTDRYVAHLEVLAAGLVDGVTLDLPVDLALAAVTLRFDPPRSFLPLDDAATTLGVVAQKDSDGIVAVAPELPLALFNEGGALLGQATTDGSGRARFTVPSASLGPAGKGELRVTFAGNGDAGANAYTLPIERRADVRLAAPDATPERVVGRLPPGSPEAGIRVHVVASEACAQRGCQGSPTGAIEAIDADGVIVGAGTLERGEAIVVATFATPVAARGGGEIPLRFRYVSDAPWFRAENTPELTLVRPVQPPGPWRRVALAAAGLVVLGWLGVARGPRLNSGRRRAALDRAARESVGREREGAIVRIESRQSGGTRSDHAPPAAPAWSGHVTDAHEGVPIAGARVAIERPDFERARVVVEVSTGPDGAFSLTTTGARPGDRLLAEAPLHAPVARALPAAGELRIALVARRRALLDRFVAWARRRGRPFDAQLEPTPRHVREATASAAPASKNIEAWADAVENAAFGGQPVDAQVEGEVERLAPPDARIARPEEGLRGEESSPPRVHPASRRPPG